MSLNIFWIILLFSSLLYILKKRRASLILFSVSILWFAIITFPFLPHKLIENLEDQSHTLFDTDSLRNKENTHIVVLGGGHGENMEFTSFDQLSDASRSRLIEGLRLFNMLPGSNLVFTGKAKNASNSHAEVMKKSAMMIGVDKKFIKILPNSENTRMEAEDYTKKFGFEDPVILVTDAAHMPRAMFYFRSFGQHPIPAPTNHMVKSEKIEDWSPSYRNIQMMDYAIHEIVGLFWAKITFWKNDSPYGHR